MFDAICTVIDRDRPPSSARTTSRLTCKTEAATERWKENDTNGEVNLPTTHGQREGSLVRPFMSERQRKNSLPDTRSRGGEGWGERERDGRLG